MRILVVINGDIDIKKLSTQLDFFIFRGSYGDSKDSKVDRNVNLCIECGKPYGLYMYSYALNTAQAKEEAQRLVNIANTYSQKPTFLCIDMEDADGYKARYGMPSNQVLTDMCNVACEVFAQAGFQPVTYASKYWFDSKLQGVKGCAKWLAQWLTSNGKQLGNNTPSDRKSANDCAIWQYTSDGYLEGYSGRLDLNYAYVDWVLGKEGSTVEIVTEKKSNEEIAEEVKIGLWGNGDERKTALRNAGYDPQAIQDIVNASYEQATPEKPTVTNYVVQRGDNLSKIASKYGVAWKDIATLNNIAGPKYIIYTGQVLKIPTSGNNVSPKPQPIQTTYKVVRGDTLSGIGKKLGKDWKTIANANGITAPYTIYTGQTLIIP